MNKIHAFGRLLFVITFWLLAGCFAGSTPPPTFASPSQILALSSTATPRPSLTLSSSPTASQTPTNTRTPTVEFVYPVGARLRNAVLIEADIPAESHCGLIPLFDCWPEQSSIPTITDMTQGIIDAGECQLDCVRKAWQKKVQNFWTSSGWDEDTTNRTIHDPDFELLNKY